MARVAERLASMCSFHVLQIDVQPFTRRALALMEVFRIVAARD